MKCPNCNAEVEDGMKFCGECGSPIPQEKKCPVCGAKVPLKMKFCSECGAKMDGSNSKGADGLSMGDKNVIAGDVIGKKEDYTIAGNATIVKNEDETKKVLSCAVCGKHLTNAEGHTCPECGRFVCNDHFDSQNNKCVLCVRQNISNAEQTYIDELNKAYEDGKIDFSERKALNLLKEKLGLSNENAAELEEKIASARKTKSVGLSRSDQVNLSKAETALYEDFDWQTAYNIAQGLYERNPNNEDVLNLYLYSLSLSDKSGKEILQFIDSLGVDFATAYYVKIDTYEKQGADNNIKEVTINEAREKYPDDFRIAFKEVSYLVSLGLTSEAKEKLDAIKEPASELDKKIYNSLYHYVNALFQTNDTKEAKCLCTEYYQEHREEKYACFAHALVADSKAGKDTIQYKIDMANEGDVIELPSGVFNESLHITKNITLKGAGIDQTIIWCDNTVAISISNIQDCKISGLSVRGASDESPDTQRTSENLVNINILNGTVEISECDLSFGAGFGLCCFNAGNVIVKNVSVHDFGESGVYVDDGCSLNAEYVNCCNNEGNGFFVAGEGSTMTLINCESYENSGNGICSIASGKAIVNGGKYYHNNTYGFYSEKSDDDAFGGIIEAESCECFENSDCGIFIEQATFNATDLKCYRNQSHGIVVGGDGSTAMLNNCESYENNGNGIFSVDDGKAIVNGGKYHHNSANGLSSTKEGDDAPGAIIEAENCECFENSNCGVIVIKSALTIANAKCYRNRGFGFAVAEVGNMALNNCESFENGASGILSQGGGKATVNGGRFYHNGQHGFFATRDNGDSVGGIIEATDCECFENNYTGAAAILATISATNLKSYRNSSSGLAVVGIGSDGTFNSCECFENDGNGILTQGGGKVTIKGGKFYRNKVYGFFANKEDKDPIDATIEADGCECFENISGVCVGKSTLTATNMKCYKNNDHGIAIFFNSATLNNCEVYENGKIGILTDNGADAIINGGKVYSNAAYGICVCHMLEANNLECFDNGIDGVHLLPQSKALLNDCKLKTSRGKAIYTELGAIVQPKNCIL